MRLLILQAMLAATSANAETLRCTPQESCINDLCQPAADPATAFLVVNSDRDLIILRKIESDTRMASISDDTWQGIEILGKGLIAISLTLTIQPTDLTYSLKQNGEFGQGISTGTCSPLPSGSLY